MATRVSNLVSYRNNFINFYPNTTWIIFYTETSPIFKPFHLKSNFGYSRATMTIGSGRPNDAKNSKTTTHREHALELLCDQQRLKPTSTIHMLALES